MSVHSELEDIQKGVMLIRVPGIISFAVVAYYWIHFNIIFPHSLPFSGVGALIVVGTYLIPGGFGLLLTFILPSHIKRRMIFNMIWAKTSGELFGRAVFVNLRKTKSGTVSGAVALLMQDDIKLMIYYSGESTGYIPKLNDLVNITINRKAKALSTELVESAPTQ